MIQRPQFLSNQELIMHIKNLYNIEVTEIEFVPVGEASWCFKAKTHKGDLFIKVPKNGLYDPSVKIPSYIHDVLHLPFTVPAIPLSNGKLWDVIHEYEVVVYPYINFPRPYGRGVNLLRTSFAQHLLPLAAQYTV